MNLSKKKMTYTTKYVFIACFFLLTVNILLGIVLMTQDKESMTILIRERMLDAAKAAGATLDGDLLASITADDAKNKTENFREVMRTLNLYLYSMDMKYIYTIKYLGGRNFVFIADSDPIDPGLYGEPVVCTEALYNASQGIAGVDETPFTDRWGDFYSAYCPVYDSNGDLAAIVGVDYDAQWYEDRIAMNTASILIITVFSLLIGATIIIFITNRFRRKIKSLYRELAELSSEMDSLNKEMATNTPLQKSSNAGSESGGQVPEEFTTSGSFDALGDKIRQARKDMKEYVTYIREQDYVDPLTGIGNKTAYLDYAKDLDLRVGDEALDYTILLFDVNNLREANDNHGLKAGDLLIIDTSTLLLRVFDPKCIFRIGSDDFIVIMENTTPNGINRALEALHGEVAVFNACERTYDTNLSLTNGIASFDPKQDHCCADVLKRATKNLSSSKAEFYKNNGDRRKR
ncbi:MAG: diguanylate cyclase [Lachnospiraceae bacterium]|nr:diguanylate cyclase [Lachnospiraceae bacterium]